MTAQEIIMMTMTIDGKQYQVPSGVVHAYDLLEKGLQEEKRAHAKTKEKYEDYKNKDIDKVAWRIALNLNAGVRPMPITRNVTEKFSRDESCLAHSIDFFQKTNGGEPILEFRREVLMRIKQALDGKTVKGENFKD